MLNNSIHETSTLEDVEQLLAVMRRHESGHYRCKDYLPWISQSSDIDEGWRQRMCEWMYSVVDHCNFRRDIVAVATAYIDMCLSIDSEIIFSRRSYQLAALTALYLSMKIYDTTFVRLEGLIKLGRGLFMDEDVLQMEQRILFKLEWRVHPPTAMCFLRHYARLIPATVSPSTVYMITEISRFIIEISVCLYKFIECPPSIIASAAAFIAMESIDESSLPQWQRHQISIRLEKAAEIPNRGDIYRRTLSKLRASFEKNVDITALMNTIDPNCHTKCSVSMRNGSDERQGSPKDVNRSISC